MPPEQAENTTYDVAVVGAGLMGACTAWALARRGLRAVVLEQFQPGHPSGSSHGSSRIFRRVYPDPFYVELTARASDSWQRLEDDTGVTLRSFTGAVDHGSGREPRRLASLLSDQSVPHQLLSAAEAQERWPHMAFDTDVLYHPDAGVLDADLAVRSALARAQADGADVHLDSRVTEVAPGHDGVLVRAANATGEMSFNVRHVVLAAGAWNQGLLPNLLGPAAPSLSVTQQQVVHFPQREPVEDWPVMVHQDEFFVFGMPAGAAAPGAIKLGEHDRGTATTAESRDGVVDPQCIDRLVNYVERFLPSLVPEPFQALSCLYTSTPTEDFVIDADGPIIVCSPCSGHGAKFAAYTGELVAEIATGTGNPPERFTLRRHSR